MHDVFIAYSRSNARIVNRLAADLSDHGIEVWLDTIELALGDPVHKTIESGIKSSRFFCIALSPGALNSYYVREIEFEQAFSRMVTEKRQSYILPIIVQRIDQALPERISHLYRLDFTSRKNYSKNVKKLVNRIRGIDTEYDGIRWFKGLNISNLGQPVGVGSTTQKSSLGMSYCIQWKRGIVTRVDVYNNGTLAHYKEFEYDDEGRVVANKMYSPDDSGQWKILDDVWYYGYDDKTHMRATKTMRYLGDATARVVHYDVAGKPTREEIMTDPGSPPDRFFPYSRKIFEYDGDGNPMGERWETESGEQIPPAK